ACWIPRAIDMFCSLTDTFRIAMLMEEEEASKVSGHSEDEDVKAQRDQVLGKDAQERHMRNYSKILLGAPYLRKLAHGNVKQQTELHAILTEKMQVIMGQARSDDTSHLKNCVAQYAAPDPSDKGLEPPIYADNKSRALLGVNHPQLAAMLCPIKHAKAYHEDPKKYNGVIRIHSATWPAFIYEGTPPGKDFDPDNVQEGFSKGYYLKWVFRHIFTSPSSAL
ncbi:uncharacterized protein HD556DRAFT_1198927, partial [Suillus plorans]